MPSAWTQNYYHAVFSTKDRAAMITPEIESRLYPFVGGIVRDLRCALLAINGAADHVHLLINYRPNLSHSDMIRHIKARSSKWINDNRLMKGRFAWQEGYGGFTVSRSSIEAVEEYIRNQKQHHERFDFDSEMGELMRRHGIDLADIDGSSALRAET